MLDGQIVAAIIVEIETQLGIYGLDPQEVSVSRSDQPTNQNAGQFRFEAFITPVTNNPIGWYRKYKNNNTDLTINHMKQKTYQISTLTKFNPSTAGDLPAHDLAEIIHDMIQQPDAIRTLKSKGVNIQECGPVRPSFQLNESDEFESMPSFDVTISYNAEYTKQTPVITEAAGQIVGV